MSVAVPWSQCNQTTLRLEPQVLPCPPSVGSDPQQAAANGGVVLGAAAVAGRLNAKAGDGVEQVQVCGGDAVDLAVPGAKLGLAESLSQRWLVNLWS
jgi:hypothetical protein